ncbi:DUF2059 domain-containing protein [Methylobacterium sp. J-076]|uniref:DUF2059 domain-containing protein n=1 Tax=Methylobacterium sp. J-076 TaxID=2836655 RepID=UPI001FB962B5|nr:DUF2059 domain-containing protein [Methylobacterium sp. J-076]MCJ2015501.1 DUF2059 domain-containing protein [Methylobacterium sp. J-076]
MSRLLAVVLGLALAAPSLPAFAQARKLTPSTPAANTPAAPAYSANHLALAREVMLSSGIARSFDSIIPSFADQIRKQAVTRPEIQKDLDEVLVSLQPELELQKQRMIDIAARTYAAKFSEAELTDIAGFFRSAAGKRYVEMQPALLDEMVRAMQGWTEEVSEYIMVRVRAEMGKRGFQLQ